MTSTATDVRERAETHLQALVGSPEAVLREDQWAAIEALAVQRRRALVVQKTGWGKSAVYFVATLLLRAQGAGPTVIISPLLALMRNQVAAAERAGIRAVTINSSNPEEWGGIEEQVHTGGVDVLLVSPERLNNPGFRDTVLPRLAAECGLLVVDEAHCISDWGHDFRPDYRRIRTLLGELPDGIPVLATTATANARVTADVAEQLGVGSTGSIDGVLVQRGSLDRESLRLAVVRLPTPEQRLAWLSDHLVEQPGSGIVYCLTVAATQEIADYLRARGHQVAAYSGQTEPAERQQLESDLAAGRIKALVATSALGMGFDAPLGFVVNMGAPPSPVAYYQQVGRAGRGTLRDASSLGSSGTTGTASVVLLPGPEDRDIWQYFASLAFPRQELVERTLDVLAEAGRPLSTPALETYVELGRSRLETMLKVLDVDGAVHRAGGGWEATGRPWVYDAERYARVAEARTREQRAMLDYIATEGCRMRFLREQLDDPGATDCGRCDNCGGITVAAEVSAEAVDEAAARLSRPGVVVEPKRLWPSGLTNLGLDLKGRISDGPDPGRAVARLTDLGYGQQLRELFRDDTPDGPVPVPLVKAVLEVLQDWRPEVTGIVYVDSDRRPTLTRDFAEGLSRYLGVPVVGAYAIVDPSVAPGQGAANSAQRVAAVSRRFALRGDVSEGARVLLVDDLVATGWSLTLASSALRRAGASGVLPLTLATRT